MDWQDQSGTIVSDDTPLGFYAIVRRGRMFTAWLHRSEQAKDSLIIAHGNDIEDVQRDVARFHRVAKPSTVHRVARKCLAGTL